MNVVTVMGAAELSIIIQHTSHVTQLLSLGYNNYGDNNYGDNMVSENIHNTHTQVDTCHSVTATGATYGELRMVIGLLLREEGEWGRGGKRDKYMEIHVHIAHYL